MTNGQLHPSTLRQVELELDELRREFSGTLSAEVVERHIAESVEALYLARVDAFRPVLIVPLARDRLRAAARATGVVT